MNGNNRCRKCLKIKWNNKTKGKTIGFGCTGKTKIQSFDALRSFASPVKCAQQRFSWLSCFLSSHALYHVAWCPDALKQRSAWFHSCLLLCTLLELFVYQSLYLSTLAGAMCKIARTWVKSHLDAQNLIHFYTAVKWLYLSIKERYMALVGSTSSIHKIYQWIKSYNIIYTPCSTCSAKK